ncbi:MAG: SCO family protein [Acidobacteriota bacterium]
MKHTRSSTTVLLLCVSVTLIALPLGNPTDAYARQRQQQQQQQQSRLPDHGHSASAVHVNYTRTVADYELPEVQLVGKDGLKTSLSSVLKHDGPIMLQFIFTTCPTICPVMSSTFSAAQAKLGEDLGKARMISISIDPEHDTPERLRDYARRFRAGQQWLFLTGSAEDIAAVQKGFDAYRGSKMRHEPLTFLRAGPGAPWVRLDGLMSATQLVAEYRGLIQKRVSLVP